MAVNPFHSRGPGALLDSLKRLILRRAPERYSRRWPRIVIAEPARVTLPDGREQPAVVNQLSVGGARIQTTVPLRAGDNVELHFDRGSGEQENILARIVYSLKENSGYYFAAGLCFLGLRAHEAQWIAAYISAEQAHRRALASADGDQTEQT